MDRVRERVKGTENVRVNDRDRETDGNGVTAMNSNIGMKIIYCIQASGNLRLSWTASVISPFKSLLPDTMASFRFIICCNKFKDGHDIFFHCLFYFSDL